MTVVALAKKYIQFPEKNRSDTKTLADIAQVSPGQYDGKLYQCRIDYVPVFAGEW